MNGKFICGGEKYKLGGVNNDVIGMSVSFDLPEEIKIQETKLYPPAPFHVSLVYVRKIIENYNISIPDFSSKIAEDFCDFVKSNPIEIIRYKNDEYKFVSRDGTKKTVIIMCELSNINKFFDLINKKYGLNIKYPAPHVTLYNTLKGKPGIYLMDQDDIKNFTVPIENPLGFSL